jgi:hypothetical protein
MTLIVSIINIGRESFVNVTNWISFVKTIENPLIVLIGNKVDQER